MSSSPQSRSPTFRRWSPLASTKRAARAGCRRRPRAGRRVQRGERRLARRRESTSCPITTSSATIAETRRGGRLRADRPGSRRSARKQLDGPAFAATSSTCLVAPAPCRAAQRRLSARGANRRHRAALTECRRSTDRDRRVSRLAGSDFPSSTARSRTARSTPRRSSGWRRCATGIAARRR